MPTELNARVEACYRLAEGRFQRSFRRPEITFKLRGQKAGVAHLQANLLRFNQRLYEENKEDFLRQTVAHEVAHLIAHALFGDAIRPHGREWQFLMQDLYQLPAQRCHSYPIQRRPSIQYLYHCACPGRVFPLSARRHTLIRQGRRYLCKDCRTHLHSTGEQTRS